MRRNAICLVVVVVATGLVWWGTVVRRPQVSQADNPFAVVPTGTRPSSRSDFSTVTTQQGTVRLRISGVDGPGPLFVAVFDSEQDFPNHHYAMRTLKVVPVDETTEVVLKDLDDASNPGLHVRVMRHLYLSLMYACLSGKTLEFNTRGGDTEY